MAAATRARQIAAATKGDTAPIFTVIAEEAAADVFESDEDGDASANQSEGDGINLAPSGPDSSVPQLEVASEASDLDHEEDDNGSDYSDSAYYTEEVASFLFLIHR